MTTLKRAFSFIMIFAVIAACSPGPHENTQQSSSQKRPIVFDNSPFDLAQLTLKESDVPALLAARHMKPDLASGTEQTLLGYEVLKTSSDTALRFNGKNLSGINGKEKNYLLIHYNATTKAIAFYEVKLYTQKQADDLLEELSKMGRPAFEKLGLSKGEAELDLNGEMVEKGKEQKQTYRVWENKKTGLTYFFGTLGTGKDFEAELTVLNRSGKYAKDWISSGSLDWYKH